MGRFRLSPRIVVLAMFAYIAAIGVVDLFRSVQQRTPRRIDLKTWTPGFLPEHVSFDASLSLRDAAGVVERTTTQGNTSVSSDLLYVPARDFTGGPVRMYLELDRKEAPAFQQAVEQSSHFEGVARILESEPAKIINAAPETPVLRWQSRPHAPLSSLYVALFGLGVVTILLVGAGLELRWAERHELSAGPALPMRDGGMAIFHTALVLGVGVFWMYELLRWGSHSLSTAWVALVFLSLFCAMVLTRGAALGWGSEGLRIARASTGVELAILWNRVRDIEVRPSFISRQHLRVVISLTSGETLRILVFGAAAEVAADAVQAQLWRGVAPAPSRVQVSG